MIPTITSPLPPFDPSNKRDCFARLICIPRFRSERRRRALRLSYLTPVASKCGSRLFTKSRSRLSTKNAQGCPQKAAQGCLQKIVRSPSQSMVDRATIRSEPIPMTVCIKRSTHDRAQGPNRQRQFYQRAWRFRPTIGPGSRAERR